MSVFPSLIILVSALGQFIFEQADGTQVSGQWVSTKGQTVVVETPGGTKELPIESLSSVRREQVQNESTAPTRIGLNDGCSIRVREVVADATTARVKLAGYSGEGSTLEIPVSSIHWVRLHRPILEPINKQWQQFVGTNRPNDILVIRAQGDRLDQAPGAISGITKDAIQFKLGDQDVNAPRDRLEGTDLQDLGGRYSCRESTGYRFGGIRLVY